MASNPPPFRTTPPPTPARVRAPPSPPTGPSAAGASSPARPHVDTSSHTVAAAFGSARDVGASASASLAGAVVMRQAADTADLPRTARTRPQDDSPAKTPRQRYGPRASTISMAQLQRGFRSICTRCKRSQSVSSNVFMCFRGCPCPRAVRPAAQPGWGWPWVWQGDAAFYSRTLERRAHRRMCFVLKRSGNRGWGTTVMWLSGLSLCLCVRTCLVGCPKVRPPLSTESTSQIVLTRPNAPSSRAHTDAHALAPNRITHQIKSH